MGNLSDLAVCKSFARIAGLLCAIAFCGLSGGAYATPSASAFNPFPTYGLSPILFTSGDLSYTLKLSSGAYLVYQGVQYPITQVWGFYAVNKTGLSGNDFTAGGSDNGDWRWEQKPQKENTLNVAGWLNPSKSEAMVTPQTGDISKDFTYSTFSYTGLPPLLGLHVTLSLPSGQPSPFSGGATGSIIPNVNPEPGGLLALGSGLMGLGGLAIRRRRI